ncbi:MAG: hypothetical protein GY769_22025 [bacterium]|nr:hypothetical protein [bacterium]
MKRIGVLPLAGIFLLAGILMLATPASAKSSKTPLDFYEIACALDAGIAWTAGQTFHVRGQRTHNISYDPVTFEVSGESSNVFNLNWNLNTGQGTSFGTFSQIYLPESDTGTFDGTWNGKSSPDGGFLGRGVGHGTADLTGKKTKSKIRSVDFSEIPPELWFILGQPPWTECDWIFGINRVTGFIHSRGNN